ncbi:hypothetical protein BJY04DRAFT_184830 [Aspergillus karnatakaensis]|uniref:uncharacterized protein n=1 Tax=Aspergillus karnatakaensis TaxID=1810916 RepID=UPI003CCDDDC5
MALTGPEDFALPSPPSDIGPAHGGIKMLACDYTHSEKIALEISFEYFHSVYAILSPSNAPVCGTYAEVGLCGLLISHPALEGAQERLYRHAYNTLRDSGAIRA